MKLENLLKFHIHITFRYLFNLNTKKMDDFNNSSSMTLEVKSETLLQKSLLLFDFYDLLDDTFDEVLPYKGQLDVSRNGIKFTLTEVINVKGENVI